MNLIYPVIVIYKTTLDECESYRTLIQPNQVSEFMVYDNSPADYVQRQTTFPKGVTYVRDTRNSGLPKAYNLAARRAAELGYCRVLLLDQDTRFAARTWQAYLRHADFSGITAPLIKTNQGSDFSPVDIQGWNPRAVQSAGPGEYSLYRCAVVNSGCCIPISLYEQSGGYKEKVKLDFADFQFQLAVRKHSPRVLLLDVEPAVQDFSNDQCGVEKLLNRYALFLESARHYQSGSLKLQVKHHYVVMRHMLALSLRTKNWQFVVKYFKDYLFNQRP